MVLTLVLGCAAAYVVLLGAKTALALRAAGRSPHPGATDLARVAILQPILSGDPRLAEILESNVIELPAAHFIWLVDTEDAVAREVCAAIGARHPQAHIDLLALPPASDGENPKLFKLERARPLIRGDLAIVLDDDTRLPASTAHALVAALGDHALSTALPAYADDGRWPSRLLAQFVNNNAALTYLPLLNVAPPVTINGMAYALTVAMLERIGGFSAMIHSVTDDLAMARRVMAAGGRICQTAAPVWVETTVRDGRHYRRQMHRWYLFALLLFRRQSLTMQALISIMTTTPSLVLWGAVIAAARHPVPPALTAIIVLLAARSVMLTALQRAVYGRALHAPALSLVSELLQPLHLLHAAVQRTIVWRTRVYRVNDDESFEIAS